MDLKIDYEETRRAGNNVQSNAADFKTLLGEISDLNGSLKQSWQGADADKYTQKIAEQAQIMNKLQASIDELGAYLVRVGDAYEKAMNENTLQ